MKSSYLTLLFWIAFLFSYSQDLTANDVNIVTASKITPSTKRYIQYAERLDGTINFNSILTRAIQKINYQGENAFLIIQKYQQSNGVDIDSSIVAINSLKPIAYRTEISTEGYHERVDFKEQQITNRIIFEDSISTSTYENKHLYNGVMINEIIGELPLAIEKVFRIHAVNPGKRYSEYVISIHVLGIETLESVLEDQVKCWKLRVNYGIPNSSTLEWYSIEGQIQVKSLFEFGNGTKFIRKMIM